MNVLLNSPRLEDLWQIHFALLGGQEYTVPGMFIANLEEPRHRPDRADAAAAAGRAGPAGTPARWAGVLDQSVGPDRWQLHGHQRPQRLQQDLQGGKLAHSSTTFEGVSQRVGKRPERR